MPSRTKTVLRVDPWAGDAEQQVCRSKTNRSNRLRWQAKESSLGVSN
jgi:hypothetical protein